jgi:hypothetical protein
MEEKQNEGEKFTIEKLERREIHNRKTRKERM